jgi:hypothetical protein
MRFRVLYELERYEDSVILSYGKGSKDRRAAVHRWVEVGILGAQLVHNKLQMGSSGANESALSHRKCANAGEYEQDRMN